MHTSAKEKALFVILVAIALLLFFSTRTEHIHIADSGEVVSAACNLGVAHPPGYPLYTLVGHLFCKLPLSTPAGRLSLFSVFTSTFTLLLFFLFIKELTQKPLSAHIGALFFATNVLFWRYSSLAEIFSLHILLAVALLYTAYRSIRAVAIKDHYRWFAIAAFCGGLGLSNNHSIVLIFPIYLAPLILHFTWHRMATKLFLGLGAASIGLTPYLYFFFASAAHRPHWGDTSSFAGLVHHFFRKDYGSLKLSLEGGATFGANVFAFLKDFGPLLGWILIPFFLLGLYCLFRRFLNKEAKDRYFTLLLPVSFILSGPVFMLMLNIPPIGIGKQVVERFYLLPIAIAFLIVGVGISKAEEFISQKNEKKGIYYIFFYASIFLFALLHFPRADVKNHYAVEDYAKNALYTVPKNSLILGTGDVRLFSMTYAQQVLNMRNDVQYVDVKMLLYPWYVAQQKEAFPYFQYVYQKGNVNTISLIDYELKNERPVFLANLFTSRILSAFGSYPVGPLLRLVKAGDPMPHFNDVLEENKRLFSGYQHRGKIFEVDNEPWLAQMRMPFAQTWIALGRVALRQKRLNLAKKLFAQAKKWAPWVKIPIKQ